MSYTILKTDGTTLGTITDGTINTSFTSLTLIGRNYANYGQLIANNLVKLVENFAYSSQPANALPGQLWWDTSTKRLKVYNGSIFKIISSATADSTPPASAISVSGDLWYDTGYSQLYVYNGADWVLVGPQRNGSGAVWEQITDTSLVVHDVLSIKLNNSRTFIFSNDSSEFTPNVTIAGFSTIKQGINANTTASIGSIWGTTNNASYLGGVEAARYLRSDINDSTDGALTIANNGGLTVGLNSNLEITTATNGDVSIKNTKSNGDINFYSNVSGTNTLSFGIDGATGTASLLSATLSGSLTLGSGATVTGALNVTGTGAFSGNLTAPTQASGVSDTTVATTEWVKNNSGFLSNKIYVGASTYIEVNDTGTGNALVVIDGTTVATASQSGFNLLSGATAVTMGVPVPTAYHQYFANSSVLGNSAVASTQYVGTATQYWSGSAKFVSTEAPNNAIGKNGDFWFQYTI